MTLASNLLSLAFAKGFEVQGSQFEISSRHESHS